MLQIWLCSVPVCCVHTQVSSSQLSERDPVGQTRAWNPLGPLEQSRLHTDFSFSLQLETWQRVRHSETQKKKTLNWNQDTPCISSRYIDSTPGKEAEQVLRDVGQSNGRGNERNCGPTLQNVLSSLHTAEWGRAVNKVYCCVAFQQSFTWENTRYYSLCLSNVTHNCSPMLKSFMLIRSGRPSMLRSSKSTYSALWGLRGWWLCWIFLTPHFIWLLIIGIESGNVFKTHVHDVKFEARVAVQSSLNMRSGCYRRCVWSQMRLRVALLHKCSDCSFLQQVTVNHWVTE